MNTFFNKGSSESSGHSWKDWSPANLRRKKYPTFTCRKKKGVFRKQNSNLIQLQEELVRSKIVYIKNENQRAQEKHNKELELLNLNILIKSKELTKL